MKTDELTITGLLFSGIVLAGMYFNSQHKINKQMTELQSNYNQAMTIAVELDEENQALHNALISMNSAYGKAEEDLQEYEHLEKLKKDVYRRLFKK